MNTTPVITAPEPVLPPRTLLQRLGSGAFGAGTLGLIGLLGGFAVPLSMLTILMGGFGQPVQPNDGSVYSIFYDGLILAVAVLVGAAQGAGGLLIGLLVGFVLNAIGKSRETAKRMLVAACILAVVSLACGFYFASEMLHSSKASRQASVSESARPDSKAALKAASPAAVRAAESPRC